jgi:hypothetical protein
MYNLDVTHYDNALIYEHDFHRFRFQVSQIVFFPSINGTNYSTPGWDGHPVTYYIWPAEWQPPVTLDYVGPSLAPPCSNATDLSGNSTESLMFIYVSLDLMKSYRTYISNDHRCNDYNEVAIFDLSTGHFHCITIPGKASRTDASYRQIIFYLVIMTLGFALVSIIGETLIGIYLME